MNIFVGFELQMVLARILGCNRGPSLFKVVENDQRNQAAQASEDNPKYVIEANNFG